MKVFIIGPEGSGKTIFVSMLDHYLKKNKEFFSIVENGETKKYLAGIRNELEKGEWPMSSTAGNLKKLEWEWQKGFRSLSFTLIDSAGQDISDALNSRQDELGIIYNIKTADILILLVDLHGHSIEKNSQKKSENEWIIESVLRIINKKYRFLISVGKYNKKIRDWLFSCMRHQKILLGITKADLFEGVLEEKNWTNDSSIIKCLEEYMPELTLTPFYSLLKSPVCFLLAFSSVCTEFQKKNEIFAPVPSRPLRSKGLDAIVAEIANKWNQQSKLTAAKYVTFFISGIFAIFALYILYLIVFSIL